MTDGRSRAKSERRDLLLETATRLLRERGSAEITLEEIADAAGVARRTIYNHFPTKDALFSALAAPIAERLAGRIRAWSPDPRDALGSLSAFLWSIWSEYGDEVELLANRALGTYPGLAGAHREFAALFASLFEAPPLAEALRFPPGLAALLTYRCLPEICRTLAARPRAGREFEEALRGLIGRPG